MADLTNRDNSHQRVLCPDEACVGVLGDDGKCPECGAIGEIPSSSDAEPAVDPDDASPAVAPDDAEPAVVTEEPVATAFDDSRELCPDGACIGIVGPDGRCKVCQKAGRSAALDPRQRAKLTDDELEAMGREELASSTDSNDEFDDRELCIDGGCIGLIDKTGRCKVCGADARAAS